MPIRPTTGGHGAPQWLLDSLRTQERTIRDLTSAINQLRRGESLAPRTWSGKSTKDTTKHGAAQRVGVNSNDSLTVHTSEGGLTNVNQLNIDNGDWALPVTTDPINNKLTIRTFPEVSVEGELFSSYGSDYKTLNFTTYNPDVSWQMSVVDGNANVILSGGSDPVIYSFKAPNDMAVLTTYNEPYGNFPGIPGDWYQFNTFSNHPEYAGVYGMLNFDITLFIKNMTTTSNKHCYLKLQMLDYELNEVDIYATFQWDSHTHSAQYRSGSPLTKDAGCEVDITGIPAGDYDIESVFWPGYTAVHIRGAAQYRTAPGELAQLKLFALTDAEDELVLGKDSTCVITPIAWATY